MKSYSFKCDLTVFRKNLCTQYVFTFLKTFVFWRKISKVTIILEIFFLKKNWRQYDFQLVFYMDCLLINFNVICGCAHRSIQIQSHQGNLISSNFACLYLCILKHATVSEKWKANKQSTTLQKYWIKSKINKQTKDFFGKLDYK